MKIAIAGIRGIPVVYSGFETFAERLATELVKKGHKVSVYCRPSYMSYKKSKYKGVNLVKLPTISGKNTETFFHSLLASLHALVIQKYDVVLYLGVGSSPVSIIPRLNGTKTIVNVDGLDWRREKWGFFGKLYLFTSEFLATIFPNEIVTDSLFIKDYYKKKFGKESSYIPYPFYPASLAKSKILKKLSIKKESYFLWGGRLVPDNHIEELLQAYKKLKTKTSLLIAGDDVHKSQYSREIKVEFGNDKRIRFLGFLKRGDYAALLKNSMCYLETKRSGGTHPSLVEAMGFGRPIIADNHRANRGVLGKTAIFYEKGSNLSLLSALKKFLALSKRQRLSLGKGVKRRANTRYSWKKIFNSYIKLFENLI